MQTVNKTYPLSQIHPSELTIASDLADLLSAITVSEVVTGVDFQPARDQAVAGAALIAQQSQLDALKVVAVAFEIHAKQSSWFLPANSEKFDISEARARLRRTMQKPAIN